MHLYNATSTNFYCNAWNWVKWIHFHPSANALFVTRTQGRLPKQTTLPGSMVMLCPWWQRTTFPKPRNSWTRQVSVCFNAELERELNRSDQMAGLWPGSSWGSLHCRWMVLGASCWVWPAGLATAEPANLSSCILINPVVDTTGPAWHLKINTLHISSFESYSRSRSFAFAPSLSLGVIFVCRSALAQSSRVRTLQVRGFEFSLSKHQLRSLFEFSQLGEWFPTNRTVNELLDLHARGGHHQELTHIALEYTIPTLTYRLWLPPFGIILLSRSHLRSVSIVNWRGYVCMRWHELNSVIKYGAREL